LNTVTRITKNFKTRQKISSTIDLGRRAATRRRFRGNKQKDEQREREGGGTELATGQNKMLFCGEETKPNRIEFREAIEAQ
jgi:hypothetical protein